MRLALSTFSILFFIFVSHFSYAEAELDELKSYSESIIEESYNIFNNNKFSEQNKEREICHFIKKHLYLEWMAKTSLGRHRRALTKEKVNEFAEVYSNFILKAYCDLSKSYSGEKAIVTKVKQIDDKMFIVNTEVIRPQDQSPIKVDYLVHEVTDVNNKKQYLVGDIITEGISILNSQQSEFNSVISNKGIDFLIDDLRKRS